MNDNKPKNKAPLIQMSERLKTALKQLEAITIFDNAPKESSEDDADDKTEER